MYIKEIKYELRFRYEIEKRRNSDLISESIVLAQPSSEHVQISQNTVSPRLPSAHCTAWTT